jgi:alpha-L-fucosidase
LAFIAEWMEFNRRSIYGCQAAPAEFACPPGCKLTYNAEKKRLYLHVFSWPYKMIDLLGQAYLDRCVYAQFLHDASELRFEGYPEWQRKYAPSDGVPTLNLAIPLVKPPVAIPVIEIYLK